MAFAYGAGFDRGTEAHIAEAGLTLADAHFVVADLVKLIALRVT